MSVPDIIGPNLKVLFVGINPGLYSAKIGHHFARSGNRFWKALFLGGFTPRLYSPYEDQKLQELGLGISNFVERESAKADELEPAEIKAGMKNLKLKIINYKPKVVCFLGMGAYRIATGNKKARLGLQEEQIGTSKIWVLPNPSGLNAHFQMADWERMFKELKGFEFKLGT
jgi:double-stranded uracil-DNA glycosylase